ncbi:outer membrane lipoprotein-sorting protein [Breznakiella homolactica]|uniref:Outer membrane lipoprotein-sorting protein n=1 Tax=Breznakiella homolactica TaxID=2798577 RepID=A0A7T7XK44_9SPIR|nr:outer membrane lipoprotein-sorting protein [Breznakiella homolactica]QQO07889.1 outer membrane lipoprotein-sorting protein [Breznakiella homolactica]
MKHVNAKKRIRMAALAGMALILPVSLFAQDGRTIMQNVYDAPEPAYLHTMVRMDLIEANGSTESRTVEEWSKTADDLTSMVMIFRSPASVRDTRFLQIENKGRDDDKWIYLPALRTTRRIAASEGSKSFMGTDASYDDMSSREVDEDTHELLSEKTVNGFDCWEVKSTPKVASSSEYSYRIVCVDKATLTPVHSLMYDKRGNLYKELTVEELRNVGGYDIPINTLLTNVQTGHATRLVITNIEVDKPVSDRVFTQNFLNTGRL